MVTTEYPHGEDFPIIMIRTAKCEAEVSLYGAQLLNWTPAGHMPVIFTSPKIVYQKGKALRGGIPLCWPWFGKHPEDSGKPSHGVARISTWQVAKTEELEDGTVRLLLALPPADDTLPSGAVMMEIGEELIISLLTMDVKVPTKYSAAMHTYFAVSDYEQVAVTGLEELAFTEFADDAIPHCEDPLLPAGHIDRIYHPVPEQQEISIHDPNWNRSIRISRAGSASCIVWNPGEQLAAGMGDLGAEASRGFLAVETGVVPAENILLRYGETHELTTRIQVISID